jgi:hypothetical protein
MLVDDLADGLADHVPSLCIACSPHARSMSANEVCSNQYEINLVPRVLILAPRNEVDMKSVLRNMK